MSGGGVPTGDHGWAECVNGVYLGGHSERIQAAAQGWSDAVKSADALHTEVLGLEAIVGNPYLWHGPTADAVVSLLKVLVTALRYTADTIRPVGHGLHAAAKSLQRAVRDIQIPPAQAAEVERQRLASATGGRLPQVTANPGDPEVTATASAAVNRLFSEYRNVTFPWFRAPALPSPTFAPEPAGRKDARTAPKVLTGAGGPQVVPMPQLPTVNPLPAPAPASAADSMANPTAASDPTPTTTPDPKTALTANDTSPVASPMAGSPRAAATTTGINTVGANGTTATGSNMYPPMYPGTGSAGAGQQHASVLHGKIREDLLHDQGVFDVPQAPPGVLA